MFACGTGSAAFGGVSAVEFCGTAERCRDHTSSKSGEQEREEEDYDRD